MGKPGFSGFRLLALACTTCLVSICPLALAGSETSTLSNVVFRAKPEGLRGGSSARNQITQTATMGTWISIWQKPQFKGTTRRQRAVPGCQNLQSPFKAKVLSMKIEWNVKDSFPLHSMCKAVYFWTDVNCYGWGIYWTVPGNVGNPNKYDYPVYSYSEFTGIYTKINAIECELASTTPSLPPPRLPPPTLRPPPRLPPSTLRPPPPAGADFGCLAPHNAARAAVGVSGLIWSTTLVASALQWANKLRDNSCGFYHSGGPFGENLYKMWGGVPTCAMAVGSWVDEKADYDYSSNKCASGKVCGHYTQIVWRNSKRVGCARSTCSVKDNIYIWVCQYDPPGNYNGQKPY